MLLIIPTFIGISIVTFSVVQLLPGSPVFLRLQAAGGMGSEEISPEIIEQTKELYGLDKPLPQRYVIWLGKLVQLDFGNAYKDGRPVLDRIAEALPITLQLNFISIVIIYLLSIPIGIYSATHQYSFGDNVSTFGLFVLYSLPDFWVAMLLIVFLGGGTYLDWFPIFGLNSIGAEDFTWPRWLLDRAWHLVLPVFCLSYASLSVLSRYARAGMIEVVRQDYIRTARAYGFKERTVIYKYALRNSLIPILTLLGLILPFMIGGSVIIESIFSIPGMGRLAFEAILSRDYPVIMGVLTITALMTLVGLIISDVLYALTDPRIRFD
jgi:peptide/nickel transport system permease protein